MATKTVNFTANTSWVQAAAGPLALTINPTTHYTDLFVGTGAPGGTANTFLLKPVAGENYLDLSLDSGDFLYIKSRQENATVSWIETPTASSVTLVNPDGSNARSTAGIVASFSFTPVAGAYSAGDIIGTAQQVNFTYADGSAVPAGSLIRMVSAVIKIDQTAVISGETSYSLALYSVTPPSAQADNAVWSLASADLPSYRGFLNLGTPVDLGAACYVKTQFDGSVGKEQDYNLGSGLTSFYARLVTTGAFTAPAVARQILLYGVVV